MEGSSVRLEYSRISTQCVNVLALGLVAGLLRPGLSFKQVEQSASSGKVFRERNKRCISAEVNCFKVYNDVFFRNLTFLYLIALNFRKIYLF